MQRLSLAISVAASSFFALQQPVIQPALPLTAATALDAIDGGTGHAVAIGRSSDEVPLPTAAIVQTSDAGDVFVQHESGDPFFTSFVAGRHYPPAAERIDPALLAQVQSAYSDGRDGDVAYAMVMFSKRMTAARIAELEQLGCRTLGFHPHYAMKAAIPVDALDRVAALDFVRWVGAPQTWQKVHPRLIAELANADAGKPIDVYIDVFESDLCAASTFKRVGTQQASAPNSVRELDSGPRIGGEEWMSNGWQQRELANAGVEVLEYVDRIRAFRARILPGALEQLVARDFVLFVEYAPAHQLDHDETMPQTLLDQTRTSFDGNSALNALVGVVDSGFDINHQALDHVYAVGWDMSSDGNVYQDDCGHGSHVIGTILGKPPAGFESLTGAAPDIGSAANLRFRIVKFLDGTSGNCLSQGSMSTAFSHMRSDFIDGSGNVTPKPHVVNCSFSSPSTVGSPWFGSEADPRTIDAEVWDHEQLYCFGAGNGGITVGNQSISDNGSAKNAFTVGSVVDWEDTSLPSGDPGNRSGFSSTGPCGDGRWKPNVTAPGDWVRSVNANTTNGYVNARGTSDANPHVTGLAAQLCDHYSTYRNQPHRLASLLMATAMPHNGEVLITPSTNPASHLNTFGAGVIDAANAHWIYTGYTERTNWGDTLNSGWSGYDDFVVDPGCQKLIVVMTYHEDQCSAGAVPALVNDLDLYIDSPTNGIDPAMNAGEYIAQQSNIDNTEIRVLLAPQSGTWRWKVYSQSTTSSVRYSVTVQQVFSSSVQSLDLTLSANHTFVQPNDDVEITGSVHSPNLIASNVFLDSTSSGDTLQASTTTLADGAVTDLMNNQALGRDVTLGAIRINDTRSEKWTTRWASEGVKTWSVDARSDNFIDDSGSVQITVDGTPPTNPTNVHSSTHTLNVWSNDPSLTMVWNAATDALSGIDGYSRTFSTGSPTPPDTVKDIGAVTSLNAVLGNGQWYFSIKAVDNCGNWFAGNTNVGPYKIDTNAPNGPTNLISTSHTMGVLSCNENVSVQWSAATDGLSGLDGYVAIINTTPVFDPTGTPTIAANLTSYAANIGSSTSARYLHLRAKDKAGNYGTTAHLGPILANANTVSTYCVGKVNSLGCVPTIGYAGVPSKSGNNFTVLSVNAISQKNGIIFWGTGSLAVPFQGGTLCVQAPTVRTPIQSSGGSASGNDCTGQYSFSFDSAYMNAWSMDPGDTIFAQAWMRDPASGSTTGLSNAIQFTVCQ